MACMFVKVALDIAVYKDSAFLSFSLHLFKKGNFKVRLAPYNANSRNKLTTKLRKKEKKCK